MNGRKSVWSVIAREYSKPWPASARRWRRLGVRRLALFGSAARGSVSDASDLDFLVEFEARSFDTYMELKELLESLFGRPVDLVLVDGLKPALRAAILEEAVDAPGL